jgi:1-acyl-sn-glycerol-3-phosphate acyltransferase
MILFYFLRSIVMTVFFLIHTVFYSCLGIVVNLIFNSKSLDDRVITSWGRLTCWSFGIRLKVHDAERIPKEGCLVLFNHSSFFDIFALAASFPFLRYGAKIELFNIPFFGPAMRRAGNLPIARNNREEVFKIYAEAKPRFQRGEKFALAPEGGRFYGKELAPFKSGPFIFAMSGGVPLLPVVIVGAHQALPKTSFLTNWKKRSLTINLYVLEPISTKEFTNDDRHQLQKIVYDRMNPIWLKHNAY